MRSLEITIESRDSAALIVAYRRHQNLEILLNLCIANNVTRIYVALDAGANRDAQNDVDRCKLVIDGFKSQYPNVIRTKIAAINLGCALSVLTACDWALEKEEFISILEDDCMPSEDFFHYMADGASAMKENSNIFLVCASQFAPMSITKGEWHLSKYPLIWGWGTSQDRWQELKARFLSVGQLGLTEHFLSYSDYTYWFAGSRRALEGYVDAWDTPLAFVLQQVDGRVLLPPENLVRNVGNDEAALHTTSPSALLNRPIGKYVSSNSAPKDNLNVNLWIRNNLFKISKRHLFSTKVTFILDRMGVHQRLRSPLLSRWM